MPGHTTEPRMWRDVKVLHPLQANVAVQSVTNHLALRRLVTPSRTYYLRASPDEAIADGDDVLKAQTVDDTLKLAALQVKHLKAVAAAGLCVPQFSSFIGESPTLQGEPSLFNLVEEKAVTIVKRSSSTYCRVIGQSLLNYLDWVEAADEEYVLDDIYKARQFGVDSQNQLWLIDIEPSFVPTNGLNLKEDTTHLQRFKQSARNLCHL